MTSKQGQPPQHQPAQPGREGEMRPKPESVKPGYRGGGKLAGKVAVIAVPRSLSQNLADKGIRVNAVAPGPIWTPLIPAIFEGEQVESFGTGKPIGRPGEPSEVAPSYLFLAREDASYTTGQVLHPNGGTIVRRVNHVGREQNHDQP